MEGARVALVVGVGNYRNFQNIDLQCCPPSAIEVYHLLTDERFGCCDPNRSILLIGEDQSIVTKEKLQKKFDEIVSSFSDQDQFIFFFCGHAKVEGEELKLLLSDSDEKNNYPFKRFFEHIGVNIYNAIMIIDACHSEEMTKAMRYYQNKDITYMWSCKTAGRSNQSLKLGKTYFSYYFCKGIRELKYEKIEPKPLVEYINKHAGMIQQAGSYTETYSWISFGNSFPFINRKEELFDIIYKNNGHVLCQIIDAPEGYGKTAFLHEAKKQLEEKGVLCSLFEINKMYEGEDQVKALLKDILFNLCGLSESCDREYDYIILIIKNIQCQLEKRREFTNHDFVFSFMVDFSGNQNNKIINFIINEFTQEVIKNFGYSKEIFFFIAGRYLSDARCRSSVKSMVMSLPAFTYENIYRMINFYLGVEKNNFSVATIAAHLYFFSGGHPEATIHILKNYGFYVTRFHDYYFVDNRKNECFIALEKYILSLTLKIVNSFNMNLKGKIEKFSVFRYYDNISIKKFFNLSDSREILSSMIEKNYIRDSDGLYINDIIRKIISISFRKRNADIFISYCKNAQNICLDRIKKIQRSELWVAEYLFQIFQSFSSEEENIGNSSAIDNFKEIMLSEISSAITEYINRENREVENDEQDEFNLKKKLRNDDELRFIINYSLRKNNELYSEQPFEDVMNYIHSVFYAQKNKL